ncbi:hypothetical protein ACWDYJ_09390, partial [Streptomyces sp. NPDC003042]
MPHGLHRQRRQPFTKIGFRRQATYSSGVTGVLSQGLFEAGPHRGTSGESEADELFPACFRGAVVNPFDSEWRIPMFELFSTRR